MCNCVDVEIGTYANSVALYPPPELGLTRVPITVDRCIAEEVQALWALGIVTAGCCCGHNKLPGSICVEDEFIPRMKELGYEVWRSESQPEREFDFYAKSVPWVDPAPYFAYLAKRDGWGEARPSGDGESEMAHLSDVRAADRSDR